MSELKIGIIFPGQGVQKTGMGRWLFDNFASAKDVFNEVDDALNMKLSDIMFLPDNAELLKRTENAQPAIMTVGMAALNVLKCDFNIDITRTATMFAGHSLGEYTALVAGGMFSLVDGARLLKNRGLAMISSVSEGKGAMVAILGIQDVAVLEEIAVESSKNGQVCEIANDNCLGQVVLSGHVEAINNAIVLAKSKGARSTVLLDVQVPSHCSLMAGASEIMRERLDETNKNELLVPVVQNVTARAESDVEVITKNLVLQMTARVKWRESMEYLRHQGINKIIEVPVGTVLKGLAKRTIPDVEVFSMNDIQELERVAILLDDLR